MRSKVVSAFGYIDGNLYVGHNPLQVATQALQAGQITAQELPVPGLLPPPLLYGWVWQNEDGQEAEFYGPNADAETDQSQFDDVEKKLRKKFPKIQEIGFGPDAATINEETA